LAKRKKNKPIDINKTTASLLCQNCKKNIDDGGIAVPTVAKFLIYLCEDCFIKGLDNVE